MKRAFTVREIKEHDKQENSLFCALWCDKNGVTRSNWLISRQVWRDNGQWDRYYQAREGKVHASRYCPTLSSTTALSWLWWHSGDSIARVSAAGLDLCRKCFPEARNGKRVRAATVCEGSGERSRCRCGGSQCRQMCPYCGQSVLVTPSGLLRRHG